MSAIGVLHIYMLPSLLLVALSLLLLDARFLVFSFDGSDSAGGVNEE
jgi:hypothetical protein